MAKNKTNNGLFDVSDLAETSVRQVKKITSQQVGSAPEERPAAPVRKPRRETKSKRVNLLVRPSVYEAIVQKADAEGVSVNELINTFMERILGV